MKFLITMLAALLTLTQGFKTTLGQSNKRTMTTVMSSFYDITEKDSKGNDVSFSKFKGKVVYGVNVASKCGYTASGYNLLSRIAALKDKGVEVALFPCNQVIFLLFVRKY